MSVTMSGRWDRTTYPKLNWHREIIDTRFLGDGIAARNTRKIHIGGLDDPFLAFGGFDELLGEAVECGD